jgi:hypothetical protein
MRKSAVTTSRSPDIYSTFKPPIFFVRTRNNNRRFAVSCVRIFNFQNDISKDRSNVSPYQVISDTHIILHSSCVHLCIFRALLYPFVLHLLYWLLFKCGEGNVVPVLSSIDVMKKQKRVELQISAFLTKWKRSLNFVPLDASSVGGWPCPRAELRTMGKKFPHLGIKSLYSTVAQPLP